MTFALEYRPRKFSELAGQFPVAAVLYQMAVRRTIPPALLFAGKHGSGKTSGARILGAALNCEVTPGPASEWPCGTCPSCKAVASGTSLDVQEIDAASNGTVETIRSMREQALYGTGGEHHIFILDEAHSMSKEAFNALLKLFEEPPPATVFILLTTESRRILPTVASRCMPFIFGRIPAGVICQRLEYICADQGLTVEPALLAAIAERADGAMRDGVMLLEQVTSVGITDLPRWQQLLGESDFAPGLLRAAADGRQEDMYAALEQAVAANGDYGWVVGQLATCMRDILVLSAGGTIQKQGAALEARRTLARRFDPPVIVGALRVLWDLQTRVRAEDRRYGILVACALISAALQALRASQPAPATIATPNSVEELTALVNMS